MKKLPIIGAIFICASVQINAQTKLENERDSAAYALGVNGAASILQEIQSLDLPTDKFLEGFINHNNSVIPKEEVEPFLQKYFQSLQAKQEAKMQELCMENTEFLRKNKENKDVVTLENGLQYKIVTKGKGNETPTSNDKVKLHYKGTLIDGTVFDSSLERGEPVTFPVDAVIAGFSQVLKLMTEGSTYIAYIPSELGYGMTDMGTIKPCSTLIFEIQLIEIIKDNDSNATTTAEEEPQKAKRQKKDKK